MRWPVVKTVFVRELKDVLRDRRTLFTMLVLPVLLYPALMIGFGKLTMSRGEKLKERTYPVMISQDGVALSKDSVPNQSTPHLSLSEELLAVEQFDLQSVADPAQAVADGELYLAVDLPADLESKIQRGEEVVLAPYHRSADDSSRTVWKAFQAAVSRWRSEQLPLKIDSKKGDQATPEEKGGHVFGGMLAMMIILMAMTGAFYPALDVAAGEKERGTLETLLLSPATRRELVMGKYLTVLAVAVVAALMNLGSMALTFSGFASMLSAQAGGASFSISSSAFIVIVVGLIITSALFAAVCLALSTFARSYKEGQAYLTPALITVMPLSMAAMLPDMELDEGLAVVPVTNMALLIKGLLVGKFPPLEIALVLGSLALLSFAALSWAASLFDREDVLFREGKQAFGLRPPPGVARPVRPGMAAAILAVLLSLVWMVQSGGLFMGMPIVTRVAAPLIGVGIIALVMNRLSMAPLRTGMQLRFTGTKGLLAGVLVGLGGIGLSQVMLQFQTGFLPEMDADNPIFAVFDELSTQPLWLLILVVGVVPAVAEELLFRGLLLQSLRNAFGWHKAIFISGIVFALFHMSIHRFFPQASLGIVLGYLVMATRSLWPAVIAHAVHNGTLVALATLLGDGQAEGAEAEFELPIWGFGAAAACLIGATTLLKQHDISAPEDATESDSQVI